MQIIKDKTMDEERALYGSDGLEVVSCRFDGPADGESALKESRNIIVRDSYFNLRYPFWHVDNLDIINCDMTQLCRAALWYTGDVQVKDSMFHGIKALRECSDITIENCDIVSPEFGWFNRNLIMKNCRAESEYFMMKSENLRFEDVYLKGKYSFQYIKDATFINCNFDTKDAFWHAENLLVKDSIVKGEYLGWYCKDVTFENCTIIGTQPLCYCKGLKLINCRMEQADLSFEKSEVEAQITTKVDSIKNPKLGTINVVGVKKMIIDDPESKAEIIIKQATI